MSHVISVGLALPENVYPQDEITATISPLLTQDRGQLQALRRVHANSAVHSRHLALPLQQYAELTSFGRANDHFVIEGTDLAERACRSALDQAGIAPAEVDFLLFTSVTGISAPSLDALLVPRLGLRQDVRRLPSFGLGCVAGAAGLARVHDYLMGHPGQVALLVSVELCSLTIQHGNDSTANLVASALFGDGAAAVVLTGEEHPGRDQPDRAQPSRGPQVLDSRSRLYPDSADQLGWHVADSGFRIVLSAELPEVIDAHLSPDVAALLADHGLSRPDVGTWVVHAGGPRVLDAVQDALGLQRGDLELSWASLGAAGNLSSASVLHVLAMTMARGGQEPGSHGVLMAFGPGVSAELVLLRWPDPG